MAIVRVDFTEVYSEEFGPRVAAVINSIMQQVLNVPPQENFIACSAHRSGMLLHHPDGVSAERLQQIVFIQITLNQGRTAELKTTFFARLTNELCSATELRPENIFINLVEVARENWSFGLPAS